jgi:ATP-binding cassette subfamily C (CFTR/MRP) protein 2
VRDSILFGSSLDDQRYEETIRRCSLIKDLKMLPPGDLTQIGEKGVLSGGQLACCIKMQISICLMTLSVLSMCTRWHEWNAFSRSLMSLLLRKYVIGDLAKKTVLLVNYQVKFLHAFDSIQVSVFLYIVPPLVFSSLLLFRALSAVGL